MSTGAVKQVLPGATLGVLGDGQLGRMFALAARRLGYRVHVFGPGADSPAGQVADRVFVADYLDRDAVIAFARSVSVITLEFENVPASTTLWCQDHAPVRPSGTILHTVQHRLREKSFLADRGLPVTAFRAVASLPDLQAAIADLGLPAVLKTAESGYDGKGQKLLKTSAEAAAAWDAIDQQPAILEAWVPFTDEVSVVLARREDGEVAVYPPIHNTHSRHILDVSVVPAPLREAEERDAVAIALATAQALDYIGVLCVEMFRKDSGEILINEIAPRPHNSGHLTIEACLASQFEQQVRAICGLPLGAAHFTRPAAMANLLGDLWFPHGEPGPVVEPNWPAALELDVALHLYGKVEPRVGRKMGHLTALADTPAAARDLVLAARARLTGGR